MPQKTAIQTELKELRPQPGPQEKFLKTKADFAIYGGARGAGKMLCLDTLVPTPDGWTTMGALRPGDLVFSELGLPIRVTHTHPVNPKAKGFRLTFDDSSQIDACDDHLWWTFTRSEQHQSIRRTDEFRAKR